jgi:hypothetical protein
VTSACITCVVALTRVRTGVPLAVLVTRPSNNAIVQGATVSIFGSDVNFTSTVVASSNVTGASAVRGVLVSHCVCEQTPMAWRY